MFDKKEEIKSKKWGAVEELLEVLGRLEAHNRNCLTNNPRDCLRLEIKQIRNRIKELKVRGE